MSENASKSSRSLCFLTLVLVCSFNNELVIAAPQPIPPGVMYREDYGLDVSSQALVEKLKQIVERKEERIEKEIAELAEERLEIQSLIDAQSKSQRENQQSQDFSVEDSEALPMPAAVYHNGPQHSGKRTSYMALCHFKICNMGRKRQKRSDFQEIQHKI